MSSICILIVEDQREISRLLRSALDTLEYELKVVEIPSGEEAILYSARNKVDLLVSDYRLPGMTGIELMHKVQKNHPLVKVILMTGQFDHKIRKEVAAAGADAFFLKPISVADFLDAVERHLGLVQTNLPPEPIAIADTKINRSLPDLLAGLRQGLAAAAVLLVNDQGRILARAGDFPDSQNEHTLISSLLSIHSAGQKVSRLIDQKNTSNWHIFNDDKYDLIWTSVGFTHAMLVIGKGIASGDKLLKTIEIYSAAEKNIEQIVGEISQGTPLTPEQPAMEGEAGNNGIKKLAPLFKGAKKRLKPAEVNEFWKKAADTHLQPSSPDMLSYEQAKQLGLAPKDKS